MKKSFSDLSKLYKSELLENIVPFWLNNSIDKENGGYFTSLSRKGEVFDTDKFVWLQAREVWSFSMLYNKLDQRQELLDAAIVGAEFLLKFGHKNFDWYFALTAKGEPLIEPYSIFSCNFAAMAFSSLYRATGDERYKEASEKTFHKILERKDNPKGKWSKTIKSTRNLKGFSLPMTLCNLALEMDGILDEEFKNQIIDYAKDEVLNTYYKEDLHFILENVTQNGEFSDTYEGRLTNPGHSMEAMWFIMDIGVRNNDQQLINKAKDIALGVLERSWDQQYGGVFYFMDVKHNPLLQLEWDQKLWWVHLESSIAMIKGYALTKDERCLEWFYKLHEYIWGHFKDNEYPEWFGYLNRRGEVSLDLKGGKWKGCYHIPRALLEISQTLDSCR
ncbi:MAG: AGE family epimerase/isomerase [Rikenellaceae bacterium]